MNKQMILGCLLAVSVGCGGGGNGTDAGSDAPTDTNATVEDTNVPPVDSAVCATTDAGMQAMPTEALAIQTGTPPVAAPADLTCLGTATIPTGGAPASATLTVTEYVSMTAIGSTPVEIFTNNVIMGACTGANCVMGTTDASGVVTLSAPAGGWVGIHLPASAGTAETLAYNQVWPAAGGNLATAGFSTASIGLVSSLLGRSFQAATAGAISGQAADCAGHAMANAEARVFHGTAQVVTGPSCDHTSPRITGLQNTNPTRAGLTGSGGTFVGANVPVGDDYHVEIWGVVTAGGAPELIGCEEGRVVAGGISVLTIGPLRSDYATGSACATVAAAHGH